MAAASLSTLVRLVESGLGATLVPVSALGSEVQPRTGVVLRAFTGTPPRRRLGLRWRKSALRVELLGEVARLCREHVAELNARIPEGVHGPPARLEAVGKE